jgi:hypothetical protein
MAAVGIDEAVAGHVPQPELERHRRVGEVVAEPAVGLEHDVLNDVAGIDAPLHDAVHPPIDHPPDGVAVAGKEAIDGVVVPLADAVEEDLRRWAIPPWRSAGGNGRRGLMLDSVGPAARGGILLVRLTAGIA